MATSFFCHGTKKVFLFNFFIHVKTMANCRKGTWKLGENIRCVGGGEIITDIRGGTVQLFHSSVCITVLESRFRYGSVCLGKNYTVK